MDKKLDEYIKAFKDKDYQMFDRFYALTSKNVYYSIISIVKDEDITADLMQDTYMNFLNKIDQYKFGSNVYAYLSRIGRNLSINYYNKYKREIHSELILETLEAQEEVIEENNMDILKLLNHLNKDQREVVVLHVINNFKFREIADIMDKPLGTVLWIYSKAIKLLKEKVGDQHE